MNTRPSFLKPHRLSSYDRESLALACLIVGCVGLIWVIGWPG